MTAKPIPTTWAIIPPYYGTDPSGIAHFGCSCGTKCIHDWDADRSSLEQVRRIYDCPNCGRRWTMTLSELEEEQS